MLKGGGILDTYGNDLYYVRTEKLNGRKCWVIQSKESEEYKTNLYWIDVKNGFVLKNYFYNEEADLKEEMTYKVQINNVTDKDVEKIDVTKYDWIK